MLRTQARAAQLSSTVVKAGARLGHEEIIGLQRAAISAGLADHRAGLVAGLSADFIASLPQVKSPGEQLLVDLEAINEAGILADGTVPLVTWLNNAIILAAGRRETAMFEDALTRASRVDEGDPGPPSIVIPPKPRWYLASFGAGFVLLTTLATLPFAFLWHDERPFLDGYSRRYPAIFVFFAFLPLMLWALYAPTYEALSCVLRERRRQRRFVVLLTGAAFLASVPTFAVASERYKRWVAPWEVISSGGFPRLESFSVPPQASSHDTGAETLWTRTTAWPAAFFFLLETDPGRGDHWANLHDERERLREEYIQVFDNDRLLDGSLRLSRAGFWHYGAVFAMGVVTALVLVNISVLAAHRHRYRLYQIPADVFRGLSGVLVCCVIWVLMRLSTARTDSAVFAEVSIFEQVLPAGTTAGAACALAALGLKDPMRREGLASFGLALGPLSLVLSYYARDSIADLFSDLRTYGACGLFVFLFVVFLVSGGRR